MCSTFKGRCGDCSARPTSSSSTTVTVSGASERYRFADAKACSMPALVDSGEH